MGKIKSAILTAIIVAAIAVLAFFATVSYTVPGSDGVKKFNSFLTSISLGGDLTGEAVSVLYPKGVISDADYRSGIPSDDTADKYKDKYEQFGSVWIEKEVLGENDENKETLLNNVKHDAEMLSKRLGEKGYSAYSVAVRDDFTIAVTVPTGFSYSEYADTDYSGSRSDKETAIRNTLTYLSFGGELSLRNSEVGIGHDNILTPITADVNSYFKSFKKFTRAGNVAVRVDLTSDGKALFESISAKVSAASNDKAVGFYIGDSQLISLKLEESVSEESFFITVPDERTAQDYAIVLQSCIKGETLALDYGSANDLEVVYASASLGSHAAIFLFCSMFALVLAAIVYSAVRYRLLGFVNAITILAYSLTVIVALLLINIELTVAVAIFAMAGLALLCGANFVVFEKVRGETLKGKTMQSAVKAGYKGLLKAILELHVVLVAVSLIIALVGVGEVAACGLIFFIASLASYILYWFTRFMWFVVSSTVRDKFAFCGFKREELEDD